MGKKSYEIAATKSGNITASVDDQGFPCRLCTAPWYGNSVCTMKTMKGRILQAVNINNILFGSASDLHSISLCFRNPKFPPFHLSNIADAIICFTRLSLIFFISYNVYTMWRVADQLFIIVGFVYSTALQSCDYKPFRLILRPKIDTSKMINVSHFVRLI